MSRLAFTALSALAAAATLVSCGGQTQPAPSSPAPAEAAPATDTSSEPPPASSAEPAPAATATPAAAAAPAPKPISEICEKMCDAQSAKCSPEKVKGCKQNYCSRYGGAPEVCDPAVRAALACTEQNPEFSVCSNVISISCAKPFRAAEKCIATGVAPEDLGPPKEMPDGWVRYESKEGAFSVALPPNVETRTEGAQKIWSAKSGNATYEISLGPPPPDEKKFDQKAFVRIGTKMLGKCGPKMKLFALVEKPESTLIHYRTVCPDKTQKRGEIYVEGKDYIVLTATWGEGPNPDADAFAFTFVRKK
jgi:hypothetical protein